MSGSLYREIRSKKYLTEIQMNLYRSRTIPQVQFHWIAFSYYKQIVLFVMHILQVMKSIGPVNNSVHPHKHDPSSSLEMVIKQKLCSSAFVQGLSQMQSQNSRYAFFSYVCFPSENTAFLRGKNTKV